MTTATFQIWRGDAKAGAFSSYSTQVHEGMVVLDAVHQIQAESANETEKAQRLPVAMVAGFAALWRRRSPPVSRTRPTGKLSRSTPMPM